LVSSWSEICLDHLFDLFTTDGTEVSVGAERFLARFADTQVPKISLKKIIKFPDIFITSIELYCICCF
jgi:hypothetical protein